ncbi:MAG: hypothetical protein QXV30_01445 [Desulfurococcaceae archaeon]
MSVDFSRVFKAFRQLGISKGYKPLMLVNVSVTLGFRDLRQTVGRGLRETVMTRPRETYKDLGWETAFKEAYSVLKLERAEL